MAEGQTSFTPSLLIVNVSCVEIMFGVSATMWSERDKSPTLQTAGQKERVHALGNIADPNTEQIWGLLNSELVVRLTRNIPV